MDGSAQHQISTKQSIAHPETVILGSQTYEIHFKVLTIAVLMQDGQQIGIGSTQWSPQDKFDYDRGKKLALREALKGQSDIFRYTFWEAYLAAARKHLENRIRQHRAAFKAAVKLPKAIVFELNEDLLKLKRGVFGCPKR